MPPTTKQITSIGSTTINVIKNGAGNADEIDYNLYDGRKLEDSKNSSQKYLPSWKDYYNDNTIEIVSRLCKKDCYKFGCT